MFVKCIGAFVSWCSMWWSNLQIAKLKARVQQLEAFRPGLRLLAAEVGYTATRYRAPWVKWPSKQKRKESALFSRRKPQFAGRKIF